MTDDLTAFLRARLDEDERVARAAARGPWKRDYHAAFMHGVKDADERSLVGDRLMESPTVNHVVRHDPARVLREVEAKRRIVERHAECGSGGGYCDDGGHGWDHIPGGGAELADLASVYADHPDYREAWRQ